MTSSSKIGIAALCLALGSSGCLKRILTDGPVTGFKDSSPAFDTLADYEIGRGMIPGGIGQLEALHMLTPANTDTLYLLTKSWSGAAFVITEDDYELAVDAGDDAMAQYHKQRTASAYSRAIFYGTQLLADTAPGFDEARRNQETIRAWLKNFHKEQVDDLIAVGGAWLSRVGVALNDPSLLGEMFVGVAMLERSIELDETAQHAQAHSILGAYHARNGIAEPEEGKKHFERAIELTQGKALIPKMLMAHFYYCLKADKPSYEKTLHEVLEAGDIAPDQRFANMLAKRRAKRYLSKSREQDCGF